MSDQVIDATKRRFLVNATSVVGGVGVLSTAVPFVESWWPSERAQAAGAPVEVDISKLEPGQMMTVAWRGRPVWIVHRSPEAVKALSEHDDVLRDPNSEVVDQQPAYAKNVHRSIKPEYAVIVGICTHLGCVPAFHPSLGEINATWPGGFFCPATVPCLISRGVSLRAFLLPSI